MPNYWPLPDRPNFRNFSRNLVGFGAVGRESSPIREQNRGLPLRGEYRLLDLHVVKHLKMFRHLSFIWCCCHGDEGALLEETLIFHSVLAAVVLAEEHARATQRSRGETIFFPIEEVVAQRVKWLALQGIIGCLWYPAPTHRQANLPKELVESELFVEQRSQFFRTKARQHEEAIDALHGSNELLRDAAKLGLQRWELRGSADVRGF